MDSVPMCLLSNAESGQRAEKPEIRKKENSVKLIWNWMDNRMSAARMAAREIFEDLESERASGVHRHAAVASSLFFGEVCCCFTLI